MSKASEGISKHNLLCVCFKSCLQILLTFIFSNHQSLSTITPDILNLEISVLTWACKGLYFCLNNLICSFNDRFSFNINHLLMATYLPLKPSLSGHLVGLIKYPWVHIAKTDSIIS